MAYILTGTIFEVEDLAATTKDFSKYLGVEFMVELISHFGVECARTANFELLQYRDERRRLHGPAQCWWINLGLIGQDLDEETARLVSEGYQLDCYKEIRGWFKKTFFKDMDGLAISIGQASPEFTGEPHRTPEEMANFKFDEISLAYPIN